MVAYNTGSEPIEIGDLGSKVKVTVTENVSKNEKKIAKNSTINIFENKSISLIEHFIAVILIPNMSIIIVNKCFEKFAITKIKKVLLIKKNLRGCELARNGSQ